MRIHNYTPAEGRIYEDYYLANIPGAGKAAERKPAPPRKLPTGSRRAEVLAALRVHGPIGSTDLAEVMGLPPHVVSSHVCALRKQGRVVYVGNQPHGKWQAAS